MINKPVLFIFPDGRMFTGHPFSSVSHVKIIPKDTLYCPGHRENIFYLSDDCYFISDPMYGEYKWIKGTKEHFDKWAVYMHLLNERN